MIGSFKKHILYAGLLTVFAVGWIGVRNWESVSTMIDNASALNEGGDAAAEIRSPDDLLRYFSEHPETVSLVVYNAGNPDAGRFVRADTPRAVPTLPKLQVALEYHRRVHAGEIDPDRPVSVDSVAVFALPGITAAGHERAVDSLAARGALTADSTAALRHWVDAALNLGDTAALDWLLAFWGKAQVRMLPQRLGLSGSDPPHPASGRYLAWMDARRSATRGSETAADADRLARAFHFAERLRADASYRSSVRTRLEQGGSGLRLREQAEMAGRTFPRGTAADYARLIARIAEADEPAERRLRARWQEPVATDSAATVVTHLASRSGAYPGLLAIGGFARRGSDHPPRVAVMVVEDLPLAVLYHLLQTGIHKGFQIQLLAEESFADRVATALAPPPDRSRSSASVSSNGKPAPATGRKRARDGSTHSR